MVPKDISPSAPPWKKGARHIPWLAFVAFAVAALYIAASISIVVLAEGRVASWKIKPNVLLEFTSRFMHAALGIALSVGVVTTWWRSALHGTITKFNSSAFLQFILRT